MRRLTTLALLALLSTAGCLDERAAPEPEPCVTWRVVHSLDAGSILEVGNRCAEPVACLVCGGTLPASCTLALSEVAP